jgi:SAM-dependent methyltransferase
VEAALRDVWFLEGQLEPIDFSGYAEDRFPGELADRVIETFSRPGEWVLDPFAGLGTTLLSAARQSRWSVGIESNPDRVEYVASKISPPHKIVLGRVQDLDLATFPQFSLVFTSPPYITVNWEDDEWGPRYFDDMRSIFHGLAQALRPDGKLVIEVSNIRTDAGFRPLIGELGEALRSVLTQSDEIVRINTSGVNAGPGTAHSSLLVFDPIA